MKKLVLIRHAKAENPVIGLEDFERKLTDTGKADAAAMGAYLVSHAGVPDVFITSPARRARKTAKKIAKPLGFDKLRLVNELRIYNAEYTTLHEVVAETGSNFQTVYLCGHNPGISEYASFLSGTQGISMPTCAVCVLEFNAESWKELEAGSGRITAFHYPGKI